MHRFNSPVESAWSQYYDSSICLAVFTDFSQCRIYNMYMSQIQRAINSESKKGHTLHKPWSWLFELLI